MVAAKKRRRGEVEKLPVARLEMALDEAIDSQGSAELAIIYLMNHYEFDLGALKAKINLKGLHVSFSKIKYSQIAPLVGHSPALRLRDVPTFEMHRARIPDDVFEIIIGDIECALKQYGPPADHKNEEPRSRYIASFFARIVAIFGLLINNTPESMMPGRLATAGRIEHQYKAFGDLTVLCIEVKVGMDTSDQYLDAVAQLIAEADGCDFSNLSHGFGVFPIHCILCDGRSFDFFIFDSSATPPFYRCQLNSSPPGIYALTVAELSVQDNGFITSVRSVCETAFYFFLLGYTTGLKAQHEQLRLRVQASGNTQESTDTWQRAIRLADNAMKCGITATAHATAGNYDKADETAKESLNLLKESMAATPSVYHRPECELQRQFNQAMSKQHELRF